ncbi:Transposase IS4 [Popillia japonica]|uniref:Transposase IS4 n=1 Tax=Popillia japonica TaxID=7064 RepID=A0AAW1JIG4_POPJA
MPNKPHKWGIKLFVLCDSNGFAYRFEIYNGAGDNIILPGIPDIGATSNVIICLSQIIPNFMHHILYFDNFYTSLPLLVDLRARGIYSLGTVRAKRIPGCKLPTDDEIDKEERGFCVEYVTSTHGVDVHIVLWKDNKCVYLVSTYVGTEEVEFAAVAATETLADQAVLSSSGNYNSNCL